MIPVQLLTILQVAVILCSTPSLAYALYGSKKLGRSSLHRNSPSWTAPPQPYQQFARRAQRYPLNYYKMYPYRSDEYYYPQDTYPLYYSPARTSKYEVYQAVMPYYYGDQPVPRPGYGFYGYEENSETADNLEDEIAQEAEREEREDSQPIGQEMLYENEGSSADDSFDDVNAAFLQNLIMSQMYKDAVNKQDYYQPYSYTDGYYPDNANYGVWEETPVNSKQSYEDEDVRELKQLAIRPQKPDNGDVRRQMLQNNFKNLKKPFNENKRDKKETSKSGVDAFTFTKPKLPAKTTTHLPSTVIPLTTESLGSELKGQKEEVLMRPATPVRHPFSGSVFDVMSKSDDTERKRAPSVYDTIKHMLDMEKNRENNYDVNELRPLMRKRIVSSEESLTQQLSLLKKHHKLN